MIANTMLKLGQWDYEINPMDFLVIRAVISAILTYFWSRYQEYAIWQVKNLTFIIIKCLLCEMAIIGLTYSLLVIPLAAFTLIS